MKEIKRKNGLRIVRYEYESCPPHVDTWGEGVKAEPNAIYTVLEQGAERYTRTPFFRTGNRLRAGYFVTGFTYNVEFITEPETNEFGIITP